MSDQSVKPAFRLVDATNDAFIAAITTNGDLQITLDGEVVDTELPAAAALSADTVANPTAPAVGSFNHYYNGASWDRMVGDLTAGLLVDLGSNNAVTVSGTVNSTEQGVETDDATISVGGAVFMGGFVFDDVTPVLPEENDAGYGRMSIKRDQHVTIRDHTAERGVAVNVSNELEVAIGASVAIVTVPPTAGSATEVQGTAADGAAAVGNPVLIAGEESGGNIQSVAVDAQGHLQVDILTGAGADNPVNPTIDLASTTDLAAAASADLDSADITEVEKVWAIHISAAIPFKVQFKAVEDGTPRNLSSLMFGRAGETLVFTPPHRNFAQHLTQGAGTDVFRATVTNMDPVDASDVHATFFYST